jgi:hypothetical protein
MGRTSTTRGDASRSTTSKQLPPASTSEEIVSDVLYTAAEVRRRLRLGAWAWRQLSRSGLPVIRTGGRVFVYGADLIGHLRTLGQSNGTDGGKR